MGAVASAAKPRAAEAARPASEGRKCVSIYARRYQLPTGMVDPPAMKTRRALQLGGAVFCLEPRRDRRFGGAPIAAGGSGPALRATLQVPQDRAVRQMVAVAGVGQLLQGVSHGGQFQDPG